MRTLAALGGVSFWLVASSTSAAALQVGPGKPYAAPCAAVAAAAGDVIEIDAAGTYQGDVCQWSKDNLTIRGVGGRPKIDAAGQASGGKGTWDAGVPPGDGAGMSLTPTRQYVHPAGSEGRITVGTIDVGAYEIGGAVGGSGGSVGTGAQGGGGAGGGGEGGSGPAGGAGGVGGESTGGTGGPSGSSNNEGGRGCRTAGDSNERSAAAALLFGALLLAQRRRNGRPTARR